MSSYGEIVETSEQLRTRFDAALYLRESDVRAEYTPNILSHLTPDEYKSVIGHSTLRLYESGEAIFSQGNRHEGIFLIHSGTARTYYVSPTGREITLAYWTHGNFVGGPEIFGSSEHIWSAVAVEKSEIYFLRGIDLKDLVRRIPNLAIGVIEGLVHKGKCYSELLQILGTRSVKNRLAHLLITLASRYGVPTDDGIVIERPYTHDELANMIGSTRQWVTKMLDIYARQGFIRKQDRFFVVRDVKSLQTAIV